MPRHIDSSHKIFMESVSLSALIGVLKDQTLVGSWELRKGDRHSIEGRQY